MPLAYLNNIGKSLSVENPLLGFQSCPDADNSPHRLILKKLPLCFLKIKSSVLLKVVQNTNQSIGQSFYNCFTITS